MVRRNPYISVVIPVHNRASTIRRSLLSVLDQSYTDLEVIVVDDHSDDETLEIIRSVSDERVSLYALEENRGAAFCRNYGAKIASGEYIAFQDSDDVWRRDKLSKQAEALNLYRPSLCISRFMRHGYEKRASAIAPNTDVPEGWIDLEQLVVGDLVGMPTVVVNKRDFSEIQFDPSLRWCEDYEWSLRFGKRKTVYLMDDILVDVYLQSDSVTIQNSDKQIAFYEKLLDDHRDLFDTFPWFYADVLGGYAKQLIRSGGKGSSYYLKAFRVAHRPKDLFKFLLSSMGMIRPFLRRD